MCENELVVVSEQPKALRHLIVQAAMPQLLQVLLETELKVGCRARVCVFIELLDFHDEKWLACSGRVCVLTFVCAVL